MDEIEVVVGERSGESRAPEAVMTDGVVLLGPSRPDLIRDELLAEMFAATVANQPQALAIRSGELRLTYAEVDARALAIARGLVRRGLGPNSVVGLWMARGAELLIAQIAVAKTGAAWLPFDADAPIDRIDICLGDSDAQLLLTSASLAAKIHQRLHCPVVSADDLVDVGDEGLVDPRALGATPDDPAYMIYTSGSTACPRASSSPVATSAITCARPTSFTA